MIYTYHPNIRNRIVNNLIEENMTSLYSVYFTSVITITEITEFILLLDIDLHFQGQTFDIFFWFANIW